jgi:hypothetical protein
MIANFFQSLEKHGVEALLISGQATVLYGAATFSEDIDLWINPTEANCARLLIALHDEQARYYKLTPQVTVDNLQRGHGFHFVLPGDATGKIFLDIMGNPPRSGSFARAAATARNMETEWGMIRTIGLQPLVELKKTQRLEDYPIISKLALAWFDQPECQQTEADFRWALQNIFTLPELEMFFHEHPGALDVAGQFNQAIASLGRELITRHEATEAVERDTVAFLQNRVAELQRADRLHWREVIHQLKALHAADALMTEGEPV